MTTAAIIGAGLSGLVVARRLGERADVTVFEKSRGAGGRIATRYGGDYQFDHGAQFFTARTPAFRDYLEPLHAAGVIANWPAQFAELDRDQVTASRRWTDEHPHFVGTPAMNSIGKHLSAELDIRFETEVARFARDAGEWVLHDADNKNLGRFDWLVLTAPGPQTADLARAYPDIVSLCQGRTMRGCFALMLGFSEPLALPWQAALVRNADISWVSVNSSKPARNDEFTLVVHSTNAWADAHIDEDIDSVLRHMMKEASLVVGQDLEVATHCQAHRWRYANIDKQTGPTCFVDDSVQLAVCGDWFLRGRIEAAFTSANELAQTLEQRI